MFIDSNVFLCCVFCFVTCLCRLWPTCFPMNSVNSTSTQTHTHTHHTSLQICWSILTQWTSWISVTALYSDNRTCGLSSSHLSNSQRLLCLCCMWHSFMFCPKSTVSDLKASNTLGEIYTCFISQIKSKNCSQLATFKIQLLDNNCEIDGRIEFNLCHRDIIPMYSRWRWGHVYAAIFELKFHAREERNHLLTRRLQEKSLCVRAHVHGYVHAYVCMHSE